MKTQVYANGEINLLNRTTPEMTIIHTLPDNTPLAIMHQSTVFYKVRTPHHGIGYVLISETKDSTTNLHEVAINVIRVLQSRKGFDGFWDAIDDECQTSIIEDIVLILEEEI